MTGDAVDRVRLRFATRSDVPRVMELLFAMHAETPHAPLSVERTRTMLGHVMANGQVAVTLDGGVPVSTMGLLVEPPWFSDQAWVRDMWLFVHPEHRRTPHARALLRCARRFATALGAPLVMEVAGGPAAGTARRVAAKARLYRRELGEATGATWVVGAAGGVHG